MTIRYYIADITGTGATSAAAFRPATAALLSGVRWDGCDGRANTTAAAGRMLVMADVSPAQHAALIADVRVTYLPFETAGGAVLGLANTISQISAANITVLTTIADTHHVPIDGLVGPDPIRFIVRRFRIRFLMRQYLAALDLVEGLATLISAIAAPRRQAINDRLTQAGFASRDAGVLGTDTVRAGIVKMVLEREEAD